MAGCKLIDVRWLDVNKAALGEPPDVQSRCVAKEFATTRRDDIFAGTPSLESAKLLLSIAATGAQTHQKQIMVMDAKRAFLHAQVTEEISISLSPEALSGDETEPVVGRLRKALYGNRNAPQNWQDRIAKVFRQYGFEPGHANPCLFRHATRDILVSIHVDDFLCLARRGGLERLRKKLSSEFEYKSAILGNGSGRLMKSGIWAGVSSFAAMASHTSMTRDTLKRS